jgi:hypothetical protein
MRIAVVIALASAALLAGLSGCGSQEEKPLFPPDEGEGGAGGEGGEGGWGSGGAGPGGMGGAGGAPSCDPSMGATTCDACVYAQCCAESAACAEGSPCDALWSCARSAGCLESASDFDACATAACKDQATSGAVGALEALSGCVRASCGGSCGS